MNNPRNNAAEYTTGYSVLYNLDSIDFFVRTYDRILHKFKTLLREDKINEIYEFVSTINEFENYDTLFDCFRIACENEKYDIIDYFINNLNFNVNKENSKCETILYILAELDRNANIIEYLIEEYDAHVNPANTIYIPLLNCFSNHFCKNNFKILMNYAYDMDLNMVDYNNTTILYNLIPFNNIEAIKLLCDIYIEKYNFNQFKKWVAYNKSIEHCFNHNLIPIAKYLINLTREIPQKMFLTKQGKFEVINIINNIKIIKHNPTFNEFYIIYSKITVSIWDPINLNIIRGLYNLANFYAFDEIYKAIHECIKYNYNIDADAVKLFIVKAKKEHITKTLQCIYRYNKRKQINPPKNISIKIIQKKWRRRKYLRKSKENCNICFEYLITEKCKLLSCKHIFHTSCISVWRSLSNICPNCRKPINTPPMNI